MTYNPRREDLSGDDVAGHAMAERPSKGVQINCHSTYDAARGDATAITGRLAREADIEGKI